MKNLTKHIDNLVNISASIEPYKITILTGSNGAGKSLIRKIVQRDLADKLSKNENESLVVQTSMQQRTESRAEWGALSGAMRDLAWTPTSMETYNKIKSLLQHGTDRFVIIDEPEIGMGEETILGLINFFNETLPKLIKEEKCLGVMIITHSRLIVQHLKADCFHNIDGMKKEEWLNRKVKPANLDKLQDRSLELFRAIQKRVDKNRKKKD